MNALFEYRSSVGFEAILQVVTAGFAVFAYLLFSASSERDGSMAPVLRKHVVAPDAIRPAKTKARSSRSK